MEQRCCFVLLKKAIVLGNVMQALSLQAQPPIAVDWIQDQLLWNDSFRGVRITGTGHTTMFVAGADWLDYPGCGTGVVAETFSAFGEPAYPYQALCLEVIGISQMFCAYQQGILVCKDVGTGPPPTVWVSGIHYSGLYEPVAVFSGPGTFFSTGSTRHALIVSGGNFFLGGETGLQSDFDSIACPDFIWKTPFPVVDLGTSWSACMDHPFRTFEMWHDTLLAIGFPTVTKVDTSNGMQAGTFDLFSGIAVGNGHTAISGDTLFWASRFSDLQLHVGRYLIGSGPVWEATLPFAGYPVELFTDDNGRLWTAAGNNLIWIDQANGSYQSYAIGQVVNGMDMVGYTVAVTGSMDGSTSYVLHGHVTP